MAIKHIGLIIIVLPLFAALAGCSETTPIPTPLPTNDQDNTVSGSGDVPIVLPTYNVPQPAGINPGKITGSVYISDKDHYFHTKDCPKLGFPSTPVNRQSAIIQGYTADPFCNP
jgi:hypothetical protein